MADRLHVVDVTQRTAAKVAGLAYLLPVVFVVYAYFGMRAPLTVRGDMAETIRRIAAAESLFRLSTTFNLVYCIGIVVLIGALYVVLSSVDRHLALLATLLRSVQAFTATLTVLSLLAIVHLASNGALAQSLGAERVQALVKLEMLTGQDQYYVGLTFWGLSSTLLSWLWLKSRYIPAALAIFGLVSSAGAALCALVYLTDPAFRQIVNWWWFDSPMALFEFTLGFWLLFKGLRDSATPVATGG
jgi:hypothetical protein